MCACVCLSVCLFVYLSVCLSVCLFCAPPKTFLMADQNGRSR